MNLPDVGSQVWILLEAWGYVRALPLRNQRPCDGPISITKSYQISNRSYCSKVNSELKQVKGIIHDSFRRLEQASGHINWTMRVSTYKFNTITAIFTGSLSILETNSHSSNMCNIHYPNLLIKLHIPSSATRMHTVPDLSIKYNLTYTSTWT